MAKGVQIPIEVVDRFSKQLSDMDKRLGQISQSVEKQQSRFNLLAADVVARYGQQALSAVINFGRESLRSFEQQEVANKKLQVAMQNLGVFTREAFNRQLDFASSLQATTTFSDDQIVKTQALLTTFGLHGEALNRVTRATLDLATAQGVDLNAAALLLGKAFVGETSSLSRYGVIVGETGSKAEKFERVMQQLQRRFGGAAQAETQTYSGQVRQLANAWDDVKERIGAIIAGEGAGIVKWMQDAVVVAGFLTEKLERVFPSTPAQKLRIEIEGLDADIKQLSEGTNAANLVAELFGARQGAINALLERRAQLQAQLNQLTAQEAAAPAAAPTPQVDSEQLALEQKMANEREMLSFDLAEKARMRIESLTMTNEELAMLDAQHMARDLEAEGQHEAAKQLLHAQSLKNSQAVAQQRMQMLMGHLAMIAGLANAKTKALAIIGKIAAANMAIINTAAGVTQALKFYPPPISFIMGAAVAAAGAAQIATIAGVQLAEGGVVPGTPLGTQATIGEMGRPEAVIPLRDPVALRMIGEAIAGAGGQGRAAPIQVFMGGVSLNISGSVAPGLDVRGLLRELAAQLKDQTVEAIEMAILSSQVAARYPLRAV